MSPFPRVSRFDQDRQKNGQLRIASFGEVFKKQRLRAAERLVQRVRRPSLASGHPNVVARRDERKRGRVCPFTRLRSEWI